MTVLNASDAITSAAVTSDALFVLTVSIRLLIIAIGLMGNFLVCTAIATDRLLQNNTNYMLFSLAVADFLVCLVVMPLNVLTELTVVNFPVCFAYVFADVLLSTASIVHMTVISMDRYFGLSNPFTKSFKSKKRTAAQIFGTWLITICITSPLFILTMIDSSIVFTAETASCGIESRGFQLYGSVFSFIIPLCITASMYILTLKILNEKASLSSQNGSEVFNNGLRRTRAPTRKNGYARTYSYNGQYKYSHASLGAPNSVYRKQTTTSAPCTDHVDHLSVGNRFENNSEITPKKPSPFRLKIDRIRCRTQSVLTVISAKVNRRGSEHSTSEKIANEKKATRVLAVVFTTFVVCWCPFFFHNIYVGFSGATNAPDLLLALFLWLGYVSSTINPLIYCGCNRRWRIAFRRILQGQCCHRSRESCNMNYSRNQTFVPPDTHTWSNFDRPAINAQINGGFTTTTLASRNAEFARENSFEDPRRRLQRRSTHLSYRNNSESSGSLERCRTFRSGKVSLVEAQKFSIAGSDKPLLAPEEDAESESFHSAAEEHPLIALSPEVRTESPDFSAFRALPKSLSSTEGLKVEDLPPPPSTKDDSALEVRPATRHVLQKETFL